MLSIEYLQGSYRRARSASSLRSDAAPAALPSGKGFGEAFLGRQARHLRRFAGYRAGVSGTVGKQCARCFSTRSKNALKTATASATRSRSSSTVM